VGRKFGARLVWSDSTAGGWPTLDADARVTVAIGDLIGTTSAVLDLVSGALVETSTYYPNGARESYRAPDGGEVGPEPAGFTGKEGDEEVGLTYFGERYLVPRIGRWATPDPLAVHAVGGGEVLNAYHYVSGNSLQARDPLGLEPAFTESSGSDVFVLPDGQMIGSEPGADSGKAEEFARGEWRDVGAADVMKEFGQSIDALADITLDQAKKVLSDIIENPIESAKRLGKSFVQAAQELKKSISYIDDEDYALGGYHEGRIIGLAGMAASAGAMAKALGPAAELRPPPQGSPLYRHKSGKHNFEIRDEYHADKSRAPNAVADVRAAGGSVKDQAYTAWSIRRKARMDARAKMDLIPRLKLQFRDLVKYGNPNGPGWKQSVARRAEKTGLEGDQLYEAIIDNSQMTDAATDRKMGR